MEKEVVKRKSELESSNERQQQLQLPSFPPGFGGSFAPGAKTGGTLGGGSAAICHLCGLPGHIVVVCPKKGA